MYEVLLLTEQTSVQVAFYLHFNDNFVAYVNFHELPFQINRGREKS